MWGCAEDCQCVQCWCQPYVSSVFRGARCHIVATGESPDSCRPVGLPTHLPWEWEWANWRSHWVCFSLRQEWEEWNSGYLLDIIWHQRDYWRIGVEISIFGSVHKDDYQRLTWKGDCSRDLGMGDRFWISTELPRLANELSEITQVARAAAGAREKPRSGHHSKLGILRTYLRASNQRDYKRVFPQEMIDRKKFYFSLRQADQITTRHVTPK